MWAIGAHPIGAPGCPDFAFSTVSAANTRIVLMHFDASTSSPIAFLAFFEAGDEADEFLLTGDIVKRGRRRKLDKVVRNNNLRMQNDNGPNVIDFRFGPPRGRAENGIILFFKKEKRKKKKEVNSNSSLM